ncbi:hypothetical protein, partial [Enterobacter cloacae complex sp. 2DZ2F20B]|uniref:hypothetical protein n=1 Tax=Enterobacter cloacae complex sp. 2DZ2F20B TaxID=2511993 RepID=UPI001CA51DB1
FMCNLLNAQGCTTNTTRICITGCLNASYLMLLQNKASPSCSQGTYSLFFLLFKKCSVTSFGSILPFHAATGTPDC